MFHESVEKKLIGISCQDTRYTWPGSLTRTLDPKNLDPENLDLEKPLPWKSWTLKNVDFEKHGKQLDMEKWLEEHIL